MVTYEARSCGLPIVATPNAGADFSPGVDGLEIPVRTLTAIAETLDRLARIGRLLACLRRRRDRQSPYHSGAKPIVNGFAMSCRRLPGRSHMSAGPDDAAAVIEDEYGG